MSQQEIKITNFIKLQTRTRLFVRLDKVKFGDQVGPIAGEQPKTQRVLQKTCHTAKVALDGRFT